MADMLQVDFDEIFNLASREEWLTREPVIKNGDTGILQLNVQERYSLPVR
jgi:hypothetical protein